METFRVLIGLDNGDVAAWQFYVRAILLFGFGILCIRVAGRRTFAQYSPLDIIGAIFVGSKMSRMMMGKAPFLPGAAATFLCSSSSTVGSQWQRSVGQGWAS